MLKKLAVWFLDFLLINSITLMLVGIIFGVTIGKPSNIKHWLNDSKIYTAAINNALEEAKKSPDSATLGQPEVQEAIRNTITPQVAQSTVEQVIDGTYHWLEGKAVKPDFRIDLTSLKASFAEQAGNAAVKRVSALPVCSFAQLRQLGTDPDPFETPCKPAGINLDTVKKQVSDKVFGNDSILKDPVVTVDTLKSKDGEQPFYQKASRLPDAYRWASKMSWIFGGLSVLLAAAIIWISSDHRKATKKLARSLLISGILLVASVLIVKWFSDKLIATKVKLSNDISDELRASITLAIKLATNSINQALLITGGVFTALSGGTLVYLRLTNKKTPRTDVPEPSQKATKSEPPKS
ncbi:MAG TPA: hypothetical protein VLG25_02160 [Patescibacteria group bacterium]|nr:hypothetical protein [Patescibacteria group bacterium]